MPKAPGVPPEDEFLIGGLHDAADVNFTYMGSLNFNLWHSYVFSEMVDGKSYPRGWYGSNAPADNLFTPKENYTGQVQGVIRGIASHNMKVLLHRPNIEYLCYGQRSDYQCDTIPLSDPRWFYAFNDHGTGVTTTDSGSGVIHCRTTPSNTVGDSPGFVVQRLKANTEQCHPETGGDAYRWDSQNKWLIKPRIRIDPVWAANNPGANVCKIIALNQNLDTIKNLDIKASNFSDGVTQYAGNYIEQFFFGANDSNLTINGHWGDKWWYSARGTRTLAQDTDVTVNRADIQVYWYGLCDMWIDYIRVDNEIAHRLLKEGGDVEYEGWLQTEARDIACYNPDAVINFFVELVEFNNLPCMKYVNKRLNQYKTCGKQLNVITDLLCFYQSHLSWHERGIIDTPENIKELYMDYTGAQEIFLGDPYPLIARRPDCSKNGVMVNSQIPNTLPITTGDSILANIVSAPADYDAWLQSKLDTVCSMYKGGWSDEYHLAGVFCYLMKSGHEVSKLTDKPFYAMIQAHQWMSSGEVDREPTIEEQNMMTNLAVSYGARGIIYWGGASYKNRECDYNYAYWEPDVTPRYNNVYGQPKWDSLIAANKRLQAWGPTLMSFNNADRKSYIYRLERSALINETYFSNIKTYAPGELHSETPSGAADSDSLTYIQASVFKDPGEPGSEYFMIVNRRCSPVNEASDGGRRFISVLFDASGGKWEITEMISGKKITVSSSGEQYAKLGWFMPGEGRLYKMKASN